VECPSCAATLVPRAFAAETLLACSECRGVVARREAVARLRAQRPEDHGWLAEARPAPSPPPSTVRTCPTCRGKMTGFAYGGGNNRVEACEKCEQLFFDRGELGAVLGEARRGIEMSEDARSALHVHRVTTTHERISSAELGLSLLGLGAVYVVFRATARLGLSAAGITVVAAITVIAALWYRRRLLRERAEGTQRLGRLMDAEMWRHEEAERQGTLAPETPAPAPSPARASSVGARGRTCPFCSASLPAGSTHCSVCDSDFG
jgi:Zn-finger nucleic acid-binding protein